MSLKTLLNGVRKTTGSVSFAESKLGDISGYINTGSYALNRIISGDINKGIPNGRVIILAGISQSGKSLISAEIAGNALREGYDIIFYFDAEGGALKQFFLSRGCDLKKIEHIPVENVEDATVKILSTFVELKAEKKENPKFRALCILDSLGALVTNKLYTDAEKGLQKSDMGGRAKLCNNLVKGCTMPALISDCSIIFVNHTYADPSAMYASKIKNQSGGEGLQYMSSITIQCDKTMEKPEDKEKENIATFYKGVKLKLFTTKNRLIKPFYETELFIDFDKGIGKYEGLLQPAIDYGFIQEGSKNGYYKVPSYSDKEDIKKTAIFDDPKVWDSFLEEFNKKSMADMKYSQKDIIEEEVIEETNDK